MAAATAALAHALVLALQGMSMHASMHAPIPTNAHAQTNGLHAIPRVACMGGMDVDVDMNMEDLTVGVDKEKDKDKIGAAANEHTNENGNGNGNESKDKDEQERQEQEQRAAAAAAASVLPVAPALDSVASVAASPLSILKLRPAVVLGLLQKQRWKYQAAPAGSVLHRSFCRWHMHVFSVATCATQMQKRMEVQVQEEREARRVVEEGAEVVRKAAHATQLRFEAAEK